MEATNLIRLKKVWMAEHLEGNGTEEAPYRRVAYFFDEEGNFLAQNDPHKPLPDNNTEI